MPSKGPGYPHGTYGPMNVPYSIQDLRRRKIDDPSPKSDGDTIIWDEEQGIWVAGKGPCILMQYKEVEPGRLPIYVSPDPGYRGLSAVLVYGCEDLLPENIRAGVTIFGVTGIYEGGDTYGRDLYVGVDDGILPGDFFIEDAELIPENIREGIELFGVTGTLKPGEDPNLIPENIRYGVTILGVTGTWTGLGTDLYVGVDDDIKNSNLFIEDEELLPGNIKSGVEIFGVTGTYSNVGSLIVAQLPSGTDTVRISYSGYTDIGVIISGVGYLTVPYTYGGIVTVSAYMGSTLIRSTTVNITSIDKYECSLT